MGQTWEEKKPRGCFTAVHRNCGINDLSHVHVKGIYKQEHPLCYSMTIARDKR